MREILFRGLRKDNGEWVYGGYYTDGKKHYIVVRVREIPDTRDWETAEYYENNPIYIPTFKEVIPETVGQFTGLLDKNGTKIFEGDICRNTKTNEIVSVAWHGTMAGFVWNERKEKSHLFEFGELFRAYDKYEVIGTIHDDPELMEVQE